MTNRLRAEKPLCWQVPLVILACASIILSLSLYYLTNLSGLVYQMLLMPLSFMAAGLVLFYSDTFRHLPGRLLLLMFLWFFLSLVVNEKFYGSLLDNRNYFYSLTVQLFVCFPLGYALTRGQLHKALRWLMRLSVLLVAGACIIGLYAVLTGQYIEPWANMDYGIGIFNKPNGDGSLYRLTILCHANSVGLIGGIALLLCLYLIFTEGHVVEKILSALFGICIYFAVALSVSRTAMLAVSVGVGLFALRGLFLRLHGKKLWLRLCVPAVTALCATLLTFCLFVPATKLVEQAAKSPQPYVADEQAGENVAESVPPQNSLVLERPMVDVGAFSGRPFIWKQALSTLGTNLRLWLLGYSPSEVGNQVSPALRIWTTQMHNSFVQILVASGLPALLFFLGFLGTLLWYCIRVFFGLNGRDAEGFGYLPAIIGPILLFSFMESFLVIYPDMFFSTLWFFIAAGAVCGLRTSAVNQKECPRAL